MHRYPKCESNLHEFKRRSYLFMEQPKGGGKATKAGGGGASGSAVSASSSEVTHLQMGGRATSGGRGRTGSKVGSKSKASAAAASTKAATKQRPQTIKQEQQHNDSFVLAPPKVQSQEHLQPRKRQRGDGTASANFKRGGGEAGAGAGAGAGAKDESSVPEHVLSAPKSTEQSPDSKFMMHATPDFDDGPIEGGNQSFLGNSNFMTGSHDMAFQHQHQQQHQHPQQHQHQQQAHAHPYSHSEQVGTLLPDVGGDHYMRDLLDPLMVQHMLTQTAGEQAVARAAQQASEPWSCPTCAAWNHPQHSMCSRCMIARPY